MIGQKQMRFQKNKFFDGLLLFLVAMLFGYLYRDVLFNLTRVWATDGNYSHGFFVPLIVGYILWQKRKEIYRTKIKVLWPAIFMMGFAGFLIIAGQISVHRFSQHLSIVIMLYSIVLLIFGWRLMKKLFLPFAFLIFMFPLPQFFRRGITEPMQLLSSYISVNILSFMKYPVYREGNIIEIPGATLSVAEACSGLRSIVALTFLAAIVGYFFLQSNRKRLILFICAFPIAIILNWVRISGTVIIADVWGVEKALGFFHNFSGLIIFGFSSILLGVIMTLLTKSERLKNDLVETDPKKSNQSNIGEISLKPVLAASILLLSIIFYGSYLLSMKTGPELDFKKFPKKLGIYSGKVGLIDPSVTEYSSVTQDRSVTYYHPSEPPIGVYIGYYRTSKRSRGFFHGTDSCLPGSGWSINKKEKLKIGSLINNERSGKVLKYISKNGRNTQVLITWIQAGDIIGTGQLEFRFRYVLDVLKTSEYNDVTKIMIQTLMFPGENEDEATKRISLFLKEFYPKFNNFISSI